MNNEEETVDTGIGCVGLILIAAVFGGFTFLVSMIALMGG